MLVKKKKGASMITIVVLFAILTTLGIATLSLVASDYQMRITASKKTQNLYASDSGINVVDAVVRKVAEQAIKDGNKKVDEFLASESELKNFKDPTGNINKQALGIEVNKRFRVAYKNSVTTYLNDTDKRTKLTQGIYVDEKGVDQDLFKGVFDKKPTIELQVGDYSFGTPVNGKELLNIIVRSSFNSTKLSGETSNTKKISAKLTIAAADYNGAYSLNSKAETIKINQVWKNAISIDGDMKLSSNFEVDGNVFVKGMPPAKVEDKVYNKYNGGIMIGKDDALSANAEDIENNKIKFNGDVITARSFNINGQNRLVEVVGNVFAGNVYVGKSTKSENAVNDTLKVSKVTGNEAKTGAVYTVNDLALNATASKIDIDKYYGINDIKNLRGDSDFNSSSSIIVNTDDIGKTDGTGKIIGSSIKINDEAVIMGSAYINTATPYQTGESVAIKGNYEAYTIPIPADKITDDKKKILAENNVQFEYNNPLQIVTKFKVDKDDNGLSVENKANYIELVDALKLLPGNKGINKSGIFLPNNLIKSGIAIKDGKIVPYDFTTDHDDTIAELQKNYSKMVYEMEEPLDVRGAPTWEDVYIKGNVNRTVFEGDEDSPEFDDKRRQENHVRQVKIDDATYNKDETSDIKAIQFVSDTKDVIILGKNAGVSPTDNATTKVIDVSSGPAQGIIITKKSVQVYGEVDFTGSIIAGGNFIAEDNKKKVIKAVDSVNMYLITKNYDFYKNIFSTYATTNQTVYLSSAAASNPSDTGEVFKSDIVKVSNWKIEN